MIHANWPVSSKALALTVALSLLLDSTPVPKTVTTITQKTTTSKNAVCTRPQQDSVCYLYKPLAHHSSRLHDQVRRISVIPLARYTSAQVSRYIVQALRITHKPLSWAKPLYWLAYHESRFYTHAVDGVAAQNADFAGHAEHAEGLFQIVPTTFYRHAKKDMRNIWNPVDNAVASIGYIAGRYRSPWGIRGMGNVREYQGY